MIKGFILCSLLLIAGLTAFLLAATTGMNGTPRFPDALRACFAIFRQLNNRFRYSLSRSLPSNPIGVVFSSQNTA